MERWQVERTRLKDLARENFELRRANEILRKASATGGAPAAEVVTCSWHRLRRRAQKHGVRPLRLHAARHTFASLALAAGRSIRWVAEQLGHANPELTLRVYAHVIPVDDQDLAFVDFSNGPGRPYTAPASTATPGSENAPGTTARRRSGFLERETGFEPATLSLGS